jgi:hypothetical protein
MIVVKINYFKYLVFNDKDKLKILYCRNYYINFYPTNESNFNHCENSL